MPSKFEQAREIFRVAALKFIADLAVNRADYVSARREYDAAGAAFASVCKLQEGGL